MDYKKLAETLTGIVETNEYIVEQLKIYQSDDSLKKLSLFLESVIKSCLELQEVLKKRGDKKKEILTHIHIFTNYDELEIEEIPMFQINKLAEIIRGAK